MNRKLLALAVASALTLPLAAQAAPTLYGQLNLSVDKVSTNAPGGADNWQVNSNSSRLGVMGEEALGSGLSAVYKAEWGVAGDVTGISDLVGRDRYLGLKGNFGTVRLGAYDSPLKTSQGMVDQFNDMNFTDMANYIVGDNRLNNAIGYTSPKLADAVTLNAVIQPGEDPNGVRADSRLANAFSASAVFEQGGLYAALGIDKDVSNGNFSSAVNTARDTTRLTLAYTMDALQLGALLQTSEISEEGAASAFKDDQTALLLSAGFSLDSKNVVKGQLIMTKDEFAIPAPDTEVTAIELGFDHNFTKMTKAYAQLGFAKTDNGGPTDQEDSVISVGMHTRF